LISKFYQPPITSACFFLLSNIAYSWASKTISNPKSSSDCFKPFFVHNNAACYHCSFDSNLWCPPTVKLPHNQSSKFCTLLFHYYQSSDDAWHYGLVTGLWDPVSFTDFEHFCIELEFSDPSWIKKLWHLLKDHNSHKHTLHFNEFRFLKHWEPHERWLYRVDVRPINPYLFNWNHFRLHPRSGLPPVVDPKSGVDPWLWAVQRKEERQNFEDWLWGNLTVGGHHKFESKEQW
jgi:hypothetical protein